MKPHKWQAKLAQVISICKSAAREERSDLQEAEFMYLNEEGATFKLECKFSSEPIIRCIPWERIFENGQSK